MSEDDVTDYLVMEAVAVKVAKQEKSQQTQQAQTEFKKDKEGLDRLRQAAK